MQRDGSNILMQKQTRRQWLAPRYFCFFAAIECFCRTCKEDNYHVMIENEKVFLSVMMCLL